MADITGTPAGWYPDPHGHHEYRWFDGSNWTEHVSSHGRQTSDGLAQAPKTVIGTTSPQRVQSQVALHDSSVATRGGELRPDLGGPLSGSLLDHLLVVVNQKVKLIEINTEFALHDPAGNQIGAVRQVGQNGFKKFLRFFGNWDQYFTHTFQIVDRTGAVVLGVTRPAKFIKSRIIVHDAVGQQVGKIVQANAIGKIRFDIEAGGVVVGRLLAENWRAWNFRVEDAAGVEVARITKTFEGVLKTMFTVADNYVLQVHRPLDDPLRQLVFASALTIDVALKQDARGFSA
jgi:uncharacterized protein YxjI